MNITVVGTGYVGLVTGTCFAETGNHVICVDIDKEKVSKMKSGIIPIYEPKLDVLFERNIKEGRLSFTSDLAGAVSESSVIFLALPTPPGEDGSADLSYILGVAKELGKLIDEYKVVIDKSTVPVGTSVMVKNQISETCSDDSLFDVVSNPEFLREGFAVDDFLRPERVIIGTSSSKARTILEDLYEPFVRQGNPIIFMDEESAELTKYASNSFLAMKITFMNEIANICELMGADVDKVRIGMGADSRIGKRFLFPGIGYGGSCFPKDVKALNKSALDHGYNFRILQSVMEVNEDQKIRLIPLIKQELGDLRNKKIAIWGLSFKPNTDDIREAPALVLIHELLELEAEISVYDPEAMNNAKKILKDSVTFALNEYESLRDADALVIATEWSVFRTPEFDKMKKLMKNPVIFDGRNLYDVNKMLNYGFDYFSIGRKQVKNTPA